MHFWDWRLLTCSNLILLIVNASLWGPSIKKFQRLAAAPRFYVTELQDGTRHGGWSTRWDHACALDSCGEPAETHILSYYVGVYSGDGWNRIMPLYTILYPECF
ncbi:hypothetical protein HDV62DRAFT_309431 [Trichoderma sp. SZMC 28011]